MTKLKLLLLAGLIVFAAASCGDDEKETDNKDSASDGSGSDEGDAGVGVTGLTACTNFLTNTFDKIRDCGTALAAQLPPNSMAGTLCGAYCTEMEGKTVTQEANDACVAFANDLPCEALELDPDAGTGGIQIPEECGFLTDDLICNFPL